MTRFTLPDLGEGLQEAEIVRWHVAVGDTVKVDQPMVAMETAKAIVEVPSPFDGVIVALHGKPGDTIGTGSPLVDFSLAGTAGATDVEAAPDEGIAHLQSHGQSASHPDPARPQQNREHGEISWRGR